MKFNTDSSQMCRTFERKLSSSLQSHSSIPVWKPMNYLCREMSQHLPIVNRVKVHFFYHRSFFYVLPSQPQAPDLSNWLLLHCKQCNQLAQVRFCDSCLVIPANRLANQTQPKRAVMEGPTWKRQMIKEIHFSRWIPLRYLYDFENYIFEIRTLQE